MSRVEPGVRRTNLSVGLIDATLLGAALLTSGCTCESGRSSVEAVTTTTAGTLAFSADPTPSSLTLDVGLLPQGQVTERTVSIPVDAEPLGLTDGYVCSSTQLPTRLEGHLQLHLSCKPQQYGALRDELRLQLQSPEREVKLKLVGEVSPRLAFDPALIDVELDYGQHATRKVQLIGQLADEASLRLVEPVEGCTSKNCRTEDLTVEQGGNELQLSFAGKLAGTRSGRLSFETGLTDPPTLALNYRLRVNGTLRVSPDPPYINLRSSGPSRVTVRVESSQPNFRVTGVRVLSGPFQARVSRQATGTASITIEADETQIEPKSHGVVGEVLVQSNDATEPERRLRVLGFGKPTTGSQRSLGSAEAEPE